MGHQPFQISPHFRSAISTTKRSKLCHNNQIPPMEAYITTVEETSSKLPSREADELKSDISHLLRQHNIHHKKHSNLYPIQCRAFTQLKQETSRVVLTADKEVSMVIMDQQDYTNKANVLLQDTNTYRVLKKDPTNSLKKQIALLRDIKQTGGLNNTKYKQLFPHQCSPPKFYGLPKIYKVGTPSGP